MTPEPPEPQPFRAWTLESAFQALLHAATLLVSLTAVVYALSLFSLLPAVIAAAAVLALIARQIPRRDGTPLLRAPGILLVVGELVLFGAAAAAAWAAWPVLAAFGVSMLIAVDVFARLPTWNTLMTGNQGRGGRIAARLTTATTVVLVAAGILSIWYWPPAAGAALCVRPIVHEGANDVWPDGRPLDQRDPEREHSAVLNAAEEFDGNAAFGTAAWWVPLWGGIATGNSTSVAMVNVNGLGVYDSGNGRVKWTLDSGIYEMFGLRSDDGTSSINGDRVHAVGETLLVHLSPERGRIDRSRDALLAFDLETGDRLWCAAGVTHLRVDPTNPDRVAVFDGAWSLLGTSDGRTVATPDVDLTVLAGEEPTPDGSLYSLVSRHPREEAVLGGGRLVLTRGPAIAVYDTDGNPIHEATLPAPRDHADGRGNGHAVYNVIADETATVVEVDSYRSQLGSREYQGTELVAFGPDGEELWRREDPDSDGALALGSYGLPGAIRVVDGVFVKSDRAIDISDGSDAWEPEDHISLRIGREHQVRDGFLYDNSDGARFAVDARDGSFVPGPLTTDPFEETDSGTFLSQTALPAGILLARSAPVGSPEEKATVMFGPPDPEEG